MTITLPTAEEIDQYGAPWERGAAGPAGVPRVADEETVCRVRLLDTGGAAYWSRGDVDVHVLYARQHGLADRPVPVAHVAGAAPPAWLAHALRERREQRQRLLRSGVRTTAAGLVLLHAPARLIVPARA